MKDIIEKSLEKFNKFNPSRIVGELYGYKDVEDIGSNGNILSGAIKDVLDKTGTGYYQFFPGFIEILKPTQVVELGGAMGVGSLCMLHSERKDFKLYSITLKESGLEFCYINKERYANFTPVIGDDLNLENWPKDLDLGKTDLWFFDSLHTEQHLRAELDLYKQFFKKGTIVMFDDMSINLGMARVYADLKNIFPIKDIYSSIQLHWTEFLIVEVGK